MNISQPFSTDSHLFSWELSVSILKSPLNMPASDRIRFIWLSCCFVSWDEKRPILDSDGKFLGASVSAEFHMSKWRDALY